jgi:amino acid adenylation domain-containing protein
MNIASTFTKALETITDNPDQRIGQLGLFSDQHRQQVREWNATIPETVNMCLHDMVTAQSRRRPEAVAVTSWDRVLTWSQLETYANQLAHHLVALGVGPEIHVMTCFEKSALAIVAMLGVLKAGGVVVSIDSSHPIQRLQHIIKDTRPLCCLVSPLNADVFKINGLDGLDPHIVLVQEELFHSTSLSRAAPGKACPYVRPENAAFVLFTSGSTGTPKGIVHEHRAIASSLEHHGKAMNIGIESRTMQFSAFVFDVSITEIFMSLTRGGVLCIPSEDERMNNLELAFNRMEANWAHLTPTVASLLDPDQVPTLKHLVLAGETLKKANLTEWAPRLELTNLYGPAECALASTLRVGCEKDDRPDNIGRAVGMLVWIVDPSNTDHLVPVGAVGEILLEGPNIAREYLKDKERTVESFIENPAWLNEDKALPIRRFYRSGDLARYNGDGSIQILGRIDTQVKLHGQRVELGEIEYQVKLNLASHGLVNVAVVYANPAGHPGGGLLAVFLEFQAKATKVDKDQLMLTISSELRNLLVKLNTCLEATLPSYMVPSMYIPLNNTPLLTSGKIDRGKLTGIVTKIPTEQVKLYSLSEFQGEKEKPRTRMERILHKLWSQVLVVDDTSIGINDSFFRLGGDSVVAMQLSAAGRMAGITITVASIFQNPKFSDMAAVAQPLSETSYHDLKRRYGIEGDVVKTIVPCTPLQEGLMLLSNKQLGTYVAQHIFHLHGDINTKHLCEAWEIVHNVYDILRTRIIHVENKIGSVQVVLDEDIVWQRSSDLDQYLKDDKLAQVSYGQPLTRYALVEEANSGDRYFVWTAHHSVFDNWSLSLLFSEIADVYNNLVSGNANITTFLKSTPYHDFAHQVFNANVSDAEAFWTAQFAKSVFSSFPRLPTGHQALADASSHFSLVLSGAELENISLLATIVQAAWAILLAQYSDSPSSVVFGMTLDGRVNPEISNFMGPTIATVPFNISLDYQLTIEELLKRVYQQTNAMQRFQHFGVQNIKKLGPNAERSCDFQSLLSIQRLKSDYAVKSSLFADIVVRDAPSTYLLLLDCQLTDTGIDMTAQYDHRIILDLQMKRILQQFAHVIRQLLVGYGSNKHLADIELCGPQDTKDISSWNQNIPSLLDMCVHEVIANHSVANPDAMAVCSWDDNLTYRKLNQLSTTLAHQLVAQFRIGPESLVPLLFTQSAWAVVAMLAVLKAGGGYVPMDPSYPSSRLQEIVNATQTSLILCSPQHKELSQSLASNALVVNGETINSFSSYEGVVCRTVHCRNVAYVIFTYVYPIGSLPFPLYISQHIFGLGFLLKETNLRPPTLPLQLNFMSTQTADCL